tara:strand:+ start:85 stop:291 length:207 start_codon:yes stop_codon:yes gene_type:complete
MVIKVLILGLILFVVYFVFFKKNIKNNKKKHNEIIDTMIECPTCGTYVSKDDTIVSKGNYFCSKECVK